jgi:MinD superfamily P-loop ATPase
LIISIASGKGGTGKTSLTAAFASLAEKALLCDADVDAADLHLLMKPDIKERAEKKSLNLSVTDGPPGIGCPVIASIGAPMPY